MPFNPYLSFNGQCEAAFKFFEQCRFNSGVVIMEYEPSAGCASSKLEAH